MDNEEKRREEGGGKKREERRGRRKSEKGERKGNEVMESLSAQKGSDYLTEEEVVDPVFAVPAAGFFRVMYPNRPSPPQTSSGKPGQELLHSSVDTCDDLPGI